VSEPRTLGSAALVRLVAGREIATRVRDKSFILSSAFIILLLVGVMAFQVVMSSGANDVRLGVVGDATKLRPALEAQAHAVEVNLTVVPLADAAAARTAVASGDVDGALLGGTGDRPSCWSSGRPAGSWGPW
jgi:ABC-2 type transport system permease protein